jgi:hypothetical protein
MSLFVLDTDHLTLYYHGDPIAVRSVDARSPTELAISVLTVDEQLTGWYTLTRQARRPEEIARAYARLGESVVRLAHWRILPYTEVNLMIQVSGPPERRRFSLLDVPPTRRRSGYHIINRRVTKQEGG